MAFLQFVPFFILVVLANYAERQQVVKYVVYGLLFLANATCILGSILLAGLHLLLPYTDLTGFLLLDADFVGMALVLFLIAALGFAVLLNPVRRWLAKRIPIRAESPLHATALSLGIYYVGFSVFQILLVGGLEGLASIPVGFTVLDLLLSGLAITLFGILGVGYLMRRNGRETLRRLGLVVPRASHLGVAAAAIVGFLALDYSVAWIWHPLRRSKNVV